LAAQAGAENIEDFDRPFERAIAGESLAGDHFFQAQVG
jgi:hypothetical protein